jgi:hypothetical protein
VLCSPVNWSHVRSHPVHDDVVNIMDIWKGHKGSILLVSRSIIQFSFQFRVREIPTSDQRRMTYCDAGRRFQRGKGEVYKSKSNKQRLG